jgi:hypothetical protein
MLTDRLQGGGFLAAPRKMTAIVAVGPGTNIPLRNGRTATIYDLSSFGRPTWPCRV